MWSGTAMWLAAGLVLLLPNAGAKIHHLTLRRDGRANIQLADFGFLLGGSLEVSLRNFSVEFPVEEESPLDALYALSSDVGFSLSRGDEVLELMRTNPGDCLLHQPPGQSPAKDAIFFHLDFAQGRLILRRAGQTLQTLQLCRDISGGPRSCVVDTGEDVTQDELPLSQPQPRDEDESSKEAKKAKRRWFRSPRRRRGVKPSVAAKPKSAPRVEHMPVVQKVTNFPLGGVEDGDVSTAFAMRILREEEEGDYYFVYHNCHNFGWRHKLPVNFHVDIVAKNPGTYLPAGDIEKPSLYFILATIFLLCGLLWVSVLRSAGSGAVYKVHHLMTVLVFLKSASLLFHGINYYFIAKHGHQQEGWAVVFYLLHLLKGALLFGVIILIGTGWTFFKGFLTERDRRLFMIVVPLQVLDNVAMIIIAESEEGQASYKFWMQLFIAFDLLCCAAVILPVIWSIRHLQEGAGTDGKAAFNLGKLRLFRHFYIIIIAYIYLTRIMKYLVAFTVAFRWGWLVVVVEEAGTLAFFALTAYKFRPLPDNPYLKLSLSDDEDEEEGAVTRSGALGDVSRRERLRAPALGDSDSEEETLLQLPSTAIVSANLPGPDLG